MHTSQTTTGTSRVLVTPIRQASEVISDGQKCKVCSQKTITKKYFSQCKHMGVCICCAEKQMKAKILINKFPTCIIQPQTCKAKMIYTPNDNYQIKKIIFEYFTNQGKQLWYQFLLSFQQQKLQSQYNQQIQIQKSIQQQQINDKSNQQIHSCKIADCIGQIVSNRCTKCLNFYCQRCGELHHSILLQCSPSASSLLKIPGLKYHNHQYRKCPKCSYPFTKDGGCAHMTCTQCKYQFCFYCQTHWNLLHHKCSLTHMSLKKQQRQDHSYLITSKSQSIPPKKIKVKNCCVTY